MQLSPNLHKRSTRQKINGCFSAESNGANVYGSELCAVLGIGLGIKRHLLSLGQGFKALCPDRGKMNEHGLIELRTVNESGEICLEATVGIERI